MVVEVWGRGAFLSKTARFEPNSRVCLHAQGAAVLSATGPQIQDVIRALQDVQVMFDDHHGVALLQQCVEGPKQFGDVVHVQTGGGFVKHKKGVASDHHGQEKPPV